MTSDQLPDPLADVPGAEYVEAVDHVGVATADLEATVAFYRNAFGLVEVHREENRDQQVVESMLAPAGRTTDRRTLIQILAPLSEDSPIGKFLDRSGPGLQQLALRVSDLAAISERLREQGLRLLFPEPRPGTAGCMINFVHPKDAGGVLIELVEEPRGN
ncbi:methylmalonyl-CoA epimerase [Microlunatus sp. Gsoil 973]|jgi:methylmalonyl-CoA/ethylmalonyl-CoA epimerase|uniref:methylmalonyl-CoA epimerase n=1 Tax=Microlunatus sp. Gsoil 973 TaxID=2672569 RepID=UPI0012B4B6BF|nr:methylmalonyl-CoA epimerase [Microlunatus sp. Gsoil 973]QGN32336.1 methylmalonyl-CoA epimerase [Microlunatus sp. Gsoil 973]